MCADCFATHPKANRDQGTRSGDGTGTGTTSWPELGHFLIISYGLHGLNSYHENRVVARDRERLRLGARDEYRCPRRARILVSSSFFFFQCPFASGRQEGGGDVREATSFHLSDAVVVSSSVEPTVRRADESGNEVRVPLAGKRCRFSSRIVREHPTIGGPDKERPGCNGTRDSRSDGFLRTLQTPRWLNRTVQLLALYDHIRATPSRASLHCACRRRSSPPRTTAIQ